MAVEIKNELRADATVDGRAGGAVIQIFGFAGFTRTGVGVYQFAFQPDEQADPRVHSIYCTTGINELTEPRGRLISPEVLEVRSYSPDGVPVDCVTLFVRVHRYPSVADPGPPLPPAPPIPVPSGGGGAALLSWGNNSIAATTTDKFLDPWYDDAAAPSTRVQWLAPRAGTLANLAILHNVPAGNGEDIVYTLEVNAALTALTATLASTGSEEFDDVNTVAVAKGARLSLIATKALAIGSSPSDIIATCNYF